MTDYLLNNTAIVILAHSDFESLELALACHGKIIEQNNEKVPPIYILLNGDASESYDCLRTIQSAERYSNLYPENIFCIKDFQGKPYFSIRSLLNSNKFKEYKYIIKLDDDVLPITKNWFKALFESYIKAQKIAGDKLAYVTSLVNNNPWGFKATIKLMNLEEEYFSSVCRKHLVGISASDPYSPFRIIDKNEIASGACGTVWRYPYIARWIHNKTTLNPNAFIEATKNASLEELNTKERYSINCLFFEKSLWEKIGINNRCSDDELLLQKFCIKHNMRAFADLSVPMCHLFFFSQRFENRDLINNFFSVYKTFLDLPYPIRICQNKDYEQAERIKYYLEGRCISNISTSSNRGNPNSDCKYANIPNTIFKARIKCCIYKVLSKVTTGKKKEHYIEKYKYLKLHINKLK